MMSLFDLAKAGNTEVFQDTYGTDTFNAQVQLFNESVRSGPAARRRILEVGPDVAVPERMTVTEVNTSQVFILAKGSIDWYKGRPIAAKHPAIPVDRTFDIRTVEQVLLNTGGHTGVYAAPSYIRRVILEEASDYLGGYEMTYSPYYSPIAPGTIFAGTTGWYRTRETSREDDLGLEVSEVVELYSPVQTMTYSSKAGKYSPATDSYSGVTPASKTVFVEPLVLDFRHEVLGFVKPEAGDLAISILKSAATTLAAGDMFDTNVVLSVESSGNIWVAHARRHH